MSSSAEVTHAPIPALQAFLHGIEVRAFVLALNQSGDAASAMAILESTVAELTSRIARLPLGQWPLEFWKALLEQPGMARAHAPGSPMAMLPPGPRAALLLRMVAGLDPIHAAQVLQVSPAAYARALQQSLADFGLDDPAVQALREQLHAQVHQPSAAQREALARLRARHLANREPAAVTAPAFVSPVQTRRRHWPWLIAGLIVVILIGSFYWPLHSALAPGHSEPLPADLVPAPPALSDAVVVTHPDYTQLARADDARMAEHLDFLSWLAASAPPGPAAATAGQAPEADASFPPGQAELLSSARSAWPMLDASTRAGLIANARDWQARSQAEHGAIRQRLRAWDVLPARARAQRRAPFRAWITLAPAQQQRVRHASETLGRTPALAQQELRSQFAALPEDSQRLWWLGPTLGEELAPISSLFGFLPESERGSLLAALSTLDEPSRRDLAALAPRLTETRRQALRQALIHAPAARRGDLIRAALAQ